MAKAVSTIMKELDKTGGYAADRKLYNDQLAALPAQYEAQVSGLDAKLARANDNILQSARSRGLGYSGPPIAEQQMYAATDYAPALANLRTQQEQTRMGILQALNGLGRDQQKQAYDIWNTNRQFKEGQRQFDKSYELQKKSASGGGGGYSYTVPSSGGGSSKKKKTSGPKVPKELQALYNQVFVKPSGGQWSDKALVSDYNATLKSAKYGNARDKQKILLYHSVRPDLFGKGVPAYALGNGGGLKF